MRIRCSSVSAAPLDLAASGAFVEVSGLLAASPGDEDHNHPILSCCWLMLMLMLMLLEEVT
jgi:hypothetical protein